MSKIIYLFFAAAFAFTCSQTFAQTSVVMKALIGTTKLTGSSTVAGHIGEIDVLSNSSGESECAGCNKPSISSYNFLMELNPSSISFKKLLLNGTKLTSVDITYIKGGSTPIEYYKIHMDSLIVESVQESSSSESPIFSVSLAPQRIAWQYRTDATHKPSYGWDILNNTEWLYY